MSPSSAEAAHEEFQQFLAADWSAWLALAPEFATGIGVRSYDDRWTDDSPEGVDRRRQQLAASLAGIRALAASDLPETDRLDYALYRELLESAEEGLPFGFDPMPLRGVAPRNLWMPLNQLDGIHIAAAEVLDLQPRETADDFERWVRRLEALPAAIDQTRRLLGEGLAHGVTPARVPLRTVPDQLAAVAPEEPGESPVVRPFEADAGRLGPGEQERLRARVLAAYHDGFVPAIARLREYVETTYLPGCRDTIAAAELPNGAAMYRFLARWQTTTPLSPAEIHAIGLAEVERIRESMRAVMAATNFRGELPAFFEYLRTEPTFFCSTPEELVDRYRAVAKRIDPALVRLFGRLPRLPYGVLPVPEFRAAASPAAYYIAGAPATGRPGNFYINTVPLSARPIWQSEALTLHEAVPGHHLQLALAQEVEGVPDFRRYGSYSAFVEGWGLYAESLGGELGLLRDPYARFGQLGFDMWRSIRLVVDTGMHALGWSREKAIRYFLDNSGHSEHDVTVEVDRYITWPGQALAYKIGQLKIRELRTRAEGRLGERFDVRAFHDLVLGEGAIPLGELERRVSAWIESAARGAAAGTGPAPGDRPGTNPF